jgi:hypothetical protein
MPRQVRDSALETRTARTRHVTRRCLALVSVPFRNNAKSLIKLLRNQLDAVSNPSGREGLCFFGKSARTPGRRLSKTY